MGWREPRHSLIARRVLSRDFIADAFDGFADLPPALAERFFDLTRRLFRLAFVAQLLVLVHFADRFFDLALGLIDFPAHFILIPHVGPPTGEVQDSCPSYTSLIVQKSSLRFPS